MEYPNANLAITTGRTNNLVVVDLDPRNNSKFGYEQLKEEAGDLEVSWVSHTGGGGKHYFFSYPDDYSVKSKNNFRQGVDIKSDGGYVILPDSSHESGGKYTWDSESNPDEIEIKKLPIDLVNILNKEPTYWLLREAQNFLNANKSDHYYPLYVTAINTGMRKGELCGLQWDCINFSKKRITIKRTMDRNGLKDSTKNRHCRHISISDSVYEQLMILKQERKSLDYVFTKPDGGHVDYGHFTQREFKKALDRSGCRKITFHNLRSTFASNFCMKGGDIFVLSRVLGHSSVTITEKMYAHLHPNYLDKSSNVVNISGDNPYLTLQNNEVEIRSINSMS